MGRSLPDKKTVLDSIRQVATTLGHPPSRSEFKAKSGMTEYQILQHFPSWREAVRAAGLEPDSTNVNSTTKSFYVIGVSSFARPVRFLHEINIDAKEDTAPVCLRDILDHGPKCQLCSESLPMENQNGKTSYHYCRLIPLGN